MQYGIATISTVWKIKLAQNDKQVEVSREREFPQRSQFPGKGLATVFANQPEQISIHSTYQRYNQQYSMLYVS